MDSRGRGGPARVFLALVVASCIFLLWPRRVPPDPAGSPAGNPAGSAPLPPVAAPPGKAGFEPLRGPHPACLHDEERVHSPACARKDPRLQPEEWTFLRYVPSAWEEEWTAVSRDPALASLPKEKKQWCARFNASASDRARAETLVELVSRTMPGSSPAKLADWEATYGAVKPQPENWTAPGIWTHDVGREDVLSKLVYAVSTAGGRKEVAAYIEPLVVHLRHPFHCPMPIYGGGDTSYIMMDRRLAPEERARAGADPAAAGPPPPFSVHYFDLGATLFPAEYPAAAGWLTTQGYFLSQYSRLNLAFDSMALWEVQKYNATDIFANVPDDLIGGYMYFNVPVAKGKGEGREFNAIAAMKHRLRKAEKVADRMLGPLEGARTPKAELKGATGSPGTYVVFKLDVDHSPTENAVMRRLAELVPGSGTGEIEVQELFFEHHTAIDEIVDGWCWAPGGRCPTLAESYDLFAGLRKVGIRAHSWI